MLEGLPATPPPSLVGGFQAGAGVLGGQLPLELVEGRGHVEEQPSLGRVVSMFLASTLSAMPRCSSGGLDHLRDGSRQPGKLPDDERVAFAQEVERGPELGPEAFR